MSINTEFLPGSTVEHPAPLRHRVSLRALWFGLVAAPGAWSVQLIVAFAFSAHQCFPRLTPLIAPERGANSLRTFLLILSFGAIAASACALLVAFRSWRATVDETRHDTHSALDVGEGRTRFMALAGVLISSVFLIAIVAQCTLIFTLVPCSQVTYPVGEVYH